MITSTTNKKEKIKMKLDNTQERYVMLLVSDYEELIRGYSFHSPSESTRDFLKEMKKKYDKAS